MYTDRGPDAVGAGKERIGAASLVKVISPASGRVEGSPLARHHTSYRLNSRLNMVDEGGTVNPTTPYKESRGVICPTF